MNNLGNLAGRLYRGEAGVNVVGKRRVWFAVAGVIVLIAIASFVFRGFSLGIDFKGGNEFIVPAKVGTLAEAEATLIEAMSGKLSDGEQAEVVTRQELRGAGGTTYLLRTTELSGPDSLEVKETLATEFRLPADQISDNRVSSAWGGQVTRQALLGLVIFLVLVIGYLIIRFEWRMAVAAVSSLALDLIATAGVYSLVGFEVTPSTIIGFLTILGFALYDVVVVFDKVQENTRGINASSTQTYGDAANLAVNQTLMRSINTGLIALLPVGGLLFIGAGLLQASTLKDLGLVLFFGMGTAVYSSIFFATPVLVTLKEQETKVKLHTQRVLARRAGGPEQPTTRTPKQAATRAAKAAAAAGDEATDEDGAVTTTTARAGRAIAKSGAGSGGSKAAAGRRSGKGGPRGGRPGGAKKR